MISPKDLSLKNKMMMAIMSTALLSIILVAIMLIILDRNAAKTAMLEQIQSIARIIADRSTATLVFNDRDSAAEMLGALRQEASIVAACIYDSSGNPFVAHRLQDPVNCPDLPVLNQYEFSQQRLKVFQPIVLEGENLGTVFIEVSLEILDTRLVQFVLVTCGVIGIVVILVYPLALQQQKFVANPVLDLVGVAEDVTKHGNYDVKLRYQSKDEIGVLYRAIDEMLHQINERKKARDIAEQSRRDAEELNKLLLSSTAEAIIGLDNNGICTFANPSCVEILGYSGPRDLIGKNITDFLLPANETAVECSLSADKIYSACQTGEKIHVDDGYFYRKDGTAFPVEYWSHPISKGASVVGVVVTFLDIEMRKNIEQQREELIKELELKNAELESFTYTVSHDLKSPLITIRSFAGLLKEDIKNSDSATVEEDVDEIYFAAEKMQLLLDDLLELSRVGRIIHDPGEISINQLVNEVTAVLKPKIADNNTKITIMDDLPTVKGDFARLFEVLLNLLENAIKYTAGQPQPEIYIGCRSTDTEYILSIKDNGVGIPQQYLSKIFGLFERLDVSQEGTGIGLALVKRIVEFHGGQVWAESDGLGTGACFYVALPKMESNDDSGNL
ncbi:MAG: ATP-binding protein [Gammaproteobacteria bacterium]|jgi:PAS domain S-box-containing protein